GMLQGAGAPPPPVAGPPTLMPTLPSSSPFAPSAPSYEPSPFQYFADQTPRAAIAAQQPIAAGVTGAGLPSWLTWGAIGGVVLLLFATARPMRPVPAKAKVH